MNEADRKEIDKSNRIVSIIALVIGIATFLCGLMVFICGVWSAITPFASDFDFIGMLLVFVALILLIVFWPFFAIGLILSIVTLFMERDMRFRLLPLVLVLFGLLLYALCYAF